MSDIRERLVALLRQEGHAPLSTHNPRDGSCQSCPWPLHEMPPEDIADAILAEFDVTPRGARCCDPATITNRIDGTWLVDVHQHHTCGTGPDGHYGAHEPGCGEVPVLNLRGLPGWEQIAPTLPSVEDVTRAMHAEVCCPCDPTGCDVQDVPEARYVRAVLALLPGRTEAEVYREGYDQGLRDAASVSRSEAEVRREAAEKALRDAADDPVAEEFLRALPPAEYGENAVETSAAWLRRRADLVHGGA